MLIAAEHVGGSVNRTVRLEISTGRVSKVSGFGEIESRRRQGGILRGHKDLTVLVVDDFSTMRRIVRNILRELEFKDILEADDGSSAVEILKTQKIDLIVSDWNMPKMTGLDLLEVRAVK